MDYDYLYENGRDWKFIPPYMRSADEYDGITIEDEETKEMTSYKVGDIVDHPLLNESMIIDISEFENGYIDIVPLTGISRGKIKTVLINNLKLSDNKFRLISTDDYDEMVNTIKNLNKAYQKLRTDCRQTKLVSMKNLNTGGCLMSISTENYKEMTNEIEKLKEENYVLKDEIVNSKLRKDINANALYYFGYQLPEVKEVLYHNPATIIFWKDGTKTVVKAQNNEKYDKEKGFVMAYLKKILGNEGNYYEEIKRWTETH